MADADQKFDDELDIDAEMPDLPEIDLGDDDEDLLADLPEIPF